MVSAVPFSEQLAEAVEGLKCLLSNPRRALDSQAKTRAALATFERLAAVEIKEVAERGHTDFYGSDLNPCGVIAGERYNVYVGELEGPITPEESFGVGLAFIAGGLFSEQEDLVLCEECDAPLSECACPCPTCREDLSACECPEAVF